jgi:methylmalonyl-CoA mutase N-terminal domain/subunit
LRTQQIVGYESGIADTVDPLAGSYYVEALTDEIEKKAWDLIAAVDVLGGSVSAIEQGFIQEEIARSAYDFQRKVETGEKIIVGVNKFQSEEVNTVPGFRIDDTIRQVQTEKLAELRNKRNPAKIDSILQGLNDRAAGEENIMPVVIEAVENNCTLGEIADTLREVYGEYR